MAEGAVIKAGGIGREIVTCDRAPHNFSDRTYDEYVGARNDAWPRNLVLISANR